MPWFGHFGVRICSHTSKAPKSARHNHSLRLRILFLLASNHPLAVHPANVETSSKAATNKCMEPCQARAKSTAVFPNLQNVLDALCLLDPLNPSPQITSALLVSRFETSSSRKRVEGSASGLFPEIPAGLVMMICCCAMQCASRPWDAPDIVREHGMSTRNKTTASSAQRYTYTAFVEFSKSTARPHANRATPAPSPPIVQTHDFVHSLSPSSCSPASGSAQPCPPARSPCS